jgi:hypothetical protein
MPHPVPTAAPAASTHADSRFWRTFVPLLAALAAAYFCCAMFMLLLTTVYSAATL